MTYNVTLIPGDAIGPEVTEATRRVLEATGISFIWDVVHAGAGVQESMAPPCRSMYLSPSGRTG